MSRSDPGNLTCERVAFCDYPRIKASRGTGAGSRKHSLVTSWFCCMSCRKRNAEPDQKVSPEEDHGMGTLHQYNYEVDALLNQVNGWTEISVNLFPKCLPVRRVVEGVHDQELQKERMVQPEEDNQAGKKVHLEEPLELKAITATLKEMLDDDQEEEEMEEGQKPEEKEIHIKDSGFYELKASV